MHNEPVKRIHLTGVCGTGMASLAALLKDIGHNVSGSDEGVYPPMSLFLADRQIPVRQGYDERNLDPAPDLVIIGNALSRGNPEIEYALNRRIPYASFPEALKQFFLRSKTPIVVTGTHGKTTTTSLLAWGLHSADLRPSFLIGGIAENFGSSYGLGGGDFFLVEGDEYDSAFFDKSPKFLHYLPYVGIIGNVEFDHADIYPNLDAIKLQFSRFANLIPEKGFLAIGSGSPDAVEVSQNSRCRKETFGLDRGSDWSAENIAMHADGCAFDCMYRQKRFHRFKIRLLGNYNVLNALAAIAVMNHLGIAPDAIRRGLETFTGVRRRLQARAEIDGIRIYEDFAHHPTAVRETLETVRRALRPERLWAIYEPRSATSRRNVFQNEISEALSAADFVAIPALFRPEKVPAGERLDLPRLVADLNSRGSIAWNLETVDRIIEKVCEKARPGDLILILSNGGFNGIYDKLPAALKSQRFQPSPSDG